MLVQRYRRTDNDRGQWAPVGSQWKTPASAGLVGHDIYHHLPDDRGTFAQEVATLGAEWYVDVQPLDGTLVSQRNLQSLERNAVDTVLNALDSKERGAFELPLRDAPALSAEDMALFASIAQKCREVLDESSDARARVSEEFNQRFVQLMLWGYAQARERFPDQGAVRRGSRELRHALADLETTEVPYGHEVTLTLQGYECSVTYTDADEQFLQANEVVPAWGMPWCTCERGFPTKEMSVHLSESDFVDFMRDRLDQQEEAGLPEEQQFIPRDDARGLMRLYVRSSEVRQRLAEARSLVISLAQFQAADYTPREVPVL